LIKSNEEMENECEFSSNYKLNLTKRQAVRDDFPIKKPIYSLHSYARSSLYFSLYLHVPKA